MKRFDRGFAVMEFLVVIVILGILVAIVVPKLQQENHRLFEKTFGVDVWEWKETLPDGEWKPLVQKVVDKKLTDLALEYRQAEAVKDSLLRSGTRLDSALVTGALHDMSVALERFGRARSIALKIDFEVKNGPGDYFPPDST